MLSHAKEGPIMVTQLPQSEPYIGQVLPPRDFTVTEALVEDYVAGLGVEARSRPPLMLANAVDTGGRLLFSQQRGHLWLRQEWEFHGPLEAGATYRVEGRVLDIYPRKERTILLTETLLRAPDSGRVVSVQRHHQSFLLSQPDEVRLRDPKEKEGARAFERPAGRDLGSIETTITLAMCGQFFHGSKNYHSDAERSRELGFRDVVVGGRMTMGYVGELLERALGDRWAESGRLLVKFTNVLWPDEPIRAQAVLAGPSAEAPDREGVFGWIEKTDGTIIVVAEGSVAR
jgi:acyl dehydratase